MFLRIRNFSVEDFFKSKPEIELEKKRWTYCQEVNTVRKNSDMAKNLAFLQKKIFCKITILASQKFPCTPMVSDGSQEPCGLRNF